MTSLAGRSVASLVGLLLVMAALLFGPPWTFDYWQAWVFIVVFSALVDFLYAFLDPRIRPT